jgi:hypothetical protein
MTVESEVVELKLRAAFWLVFHDDFPVFYARFFAQKAFGKDAAGLTAVNSFEENDSLRFTRP